MVAASYLGVIDDPGTGSAYADLVLMHSPLLYWRLGESSGAAAMDSSGNSRGGTYINAPLLGEDGLVIDDPATSVKFVHTNETRLTRPYEAWMSTASFTVTCVYVGNPVTSDLRILASRYVDSGTDWSWYLYTEDRVFKFCYQGSGGEIVTLDTGLEAGFGVTHYVAAWAGPGGAGIRIYDGTGLVASATGAGHPVKNSGRSLTVSGCDTTHSYHVAGSMQEVAYFNAALSTVVLDELATTAIAPQPKWLNRTVAVAPRNGTNAHTLTFPAASVGSLLVAVLGGAVTHTAVTGGWTKQLGPVNATELAVFTRLASGGETSFQVTHNASNYPINYVVYEFPAGTTYVAGVGANSGDPPMLTGLPGTPVTVFTALSSISNSPSDPVAVTQWSWHWTEDVDQTVLGNGVTHGAYLELGWRSFVTRTAIDPANEGFYDSVWRWDVEPPSSVTSAVFALNIP